MLCVGGKLQLIYWHGSFWLKISDRRERCLLTFGFFNLIVTGSHSTCSSIVSTIMFIIQFNFFFLILGHDTCVEFVSVELLNEVISSSFVSKSSSVPLVCSFCNIFSGTNSFILRFCQNTFNLKTRCTWTSRDHGIDDARRKWARGNAILIYFTK